MIKTNLIASKQLFVAIGSLVLINSCSFNQDNRQRSDHVSATGIGIFGWTFKRQPDYSKISSDFKGPKPVHKDSVGMPTSAQESVTSADGKRIFIVSPEKLTPDATDGILNIYRFEVPSDVGMGYGNPVLVSKRPAVQLRSDCGIVSVPEASADGDSYGISVSADGQQIAFISNATNLAPIAECNDAKTSSIYKNQSVGVSETQVYLLDLSTKNTLTLVTGVDTDRGRVGSASRPSSVPSISGNGKIVAFGSSDVFLDSFFSKKALPKNSDGYPGIFLFDSVTRKIAMATFPGVTADAYTADFSKLDGPSYQPKLNYDGSVLAFTSKAALISEDQTLPTTDASGSTDTVADVYRAVFAKEGSSVNVGKRLNLELVSVDYGKTTSTGIFGSSSPTITADGRYVGFISTKLIELIADGWIPNRIPRIADHYGTNVYLRDTVTKTTSLISASVTQNDTIYAFNEIRGEANAGNPVISPDGKYMSFTHGETEVYMTKKMKDYMARSPIVAGKPADNCYHVAMFGNDTKIWFYEDFTKPAVESDLGWQDVKKSNCLAALHPFTFQKRQAYLVQLDLAGLKPIRMVPLSISQPVHMTNWAPDALKEPHWDIIDPHSASTSDPSKPAAKLGVGGIGHFTPVYQLLYGDKDSSVSAISNDAKTITFQSAADSLLGDNRTAEDFAKYKNSDGDYLLALYPDIMFYDMCPDLRFAAGTGRECLGIYYASNVIPHTTTWAYTPSNPVVWNLEAK